MRSFFLSFCEDIFFTRRNVVISLGGFLFLRFFSFLVEVPDTSLTTTNRVDEFGSLTLGEVFPPQFLCGFLFHPEESCDFSGWFPFFVGVMDLLGFGIFADRFFICCCNEIL